VSVSKPEIKAVLESTRDATNHPRVRRTMDRALKILDQAYDDSGVLDATKILLREMAAVKRAERMLLWLRPLAALVITAFLFMILKGFFLAI